MSNYLHPNISEVAADQPRRPKRRRARWLVAGVAGLTGVAGLAAFTPAVSGAFAKSGNSVSNAAKQVLADDKRADDSGGQERGGRDGKDHEKDDHRDGRGDDFRSVPCNSDELIAAIVRANASSGAKLRLAEKCTYTLNRSAPQPPVPFGAVGLPIITQQVVIDGNGSTVVRAANATPFRILEVGTGGDLTLRDVTIKGGLADGGLGEGGGGIRIDVGGRATIEDTDVVYNHTNGPGGGIANFGVTKILGGNDHGRDWDGKDKDKKKDGGSTISNNSAVFDGGGIFNNGNLTVQNTRLSYNNTIGTFNIVPIGGAGGGLSNSSVALLENVHLHNNTAGFRGGGIRGGINSTTEARNVEINENRAGSEGGGIFTDGAFYLKHGKVHHNEAGQRGGGVFNQINQFVAEESSISENVASTNSTIEHGGGIYNTSGTVVLRRTHVDRNRAIGSQSRGGGIYNNFRLTLTESKVTDNISTLAPGGIFNDGGQVTVDQKTAITGNRPTNCTPSSPPVPNCFG